MAEDKNKDLLTAHGESIAILSIRMAALEDILLSKGIITKEELTDSFVKMKDKFIKQMNAELQNLNNTGTIQ